MKQTKIIACLVISILVVVSATSAVSAQTVKATPDYPPLPPNTVDIKYDDGHIATLDDYTNINGFVGMYHAIRVRFTPPEDAKDLQQIRVAFAGWLLYKRGLKLSIVDVDTGATVSNVYGATDVPLKDVGEYPWDKEWSVFDVSYFGFEMDGDFYVELRPLKDTFEWEVWVDYTPPIDERSEELSDYPPRWVVDEKRDYMIRAVVSTGDCAAEYAVYQAGIPNPDEILNPLRELRDDNLKDGYVDRYYDYSPELTVVITKDPALTFKAARLLLKYSPMVQYHVYGIGVDKQITRRDVKEILSFTDRLKRSVWKNRDEMGTERSEEIIKFLDEFKEQVKASEGKTFSEALQDSIYCKDEQIPVGDLQHQTGQL